MNNNIFIPKQINIGFQDRNDTYTEKLAYIIYYDNKGVLRKEKSWQTWRDEKIPNVIYDNEPTSGFVLNKKAGGYSTGWNHRQTYVRVYDPRGFEFEITVPNLLYILENTNSIKGKGLEGEFIYGWEGTELLLIPTSSPDYAELVAFNETLHENKIIKAKDLAVGATYKTKDNKEVVYLGKFQTHHYGAGVTGKEFYFYDRTNSVFITMKNINDKLISILNEDCALDYVELFDGLEVQAIYSPYDASKDEFIEYTLDEFKTYFSNKNFLFCYSKYNTIREEIEIKIENKWNNNKGYDVNTLQVRNAPTRSNHHSEKLIKEGNIEMIYNEFKPMYKNKYLKNGRLYERGNI